MELFFKIMLPLHIFCGFASLISGCIAMIAKKGKRVHRIAGKVFFYNMLGVSASALAIAYLKWNTFLLMIGIFAFFQNYSGYRSIKNKSLKPSVMDWTVLALAAVNSFFMLYSMQLVLMVFGGISSALVIGDLRIFLLSTKGKELKKQQWLLRHIGMMIGAYIATFTAFLVVNIKHFNPYWLPWLAPTFVLVPVIVYWTRKVSIKVKPAVQKSAVLLLTIVSIAATTDAQPYIQGKTRHRFAQLNLGADICVYPGTGSQSYLNTADKFQLGNQTETRLIMGGTHFWGHADFFVAFKVVSLGASGFSTFVETGGKYFPWQIENKKLRPYIGMSWLPTIYQQGDGVYQLRNKYPLTAGLVYNRGSHLIELSAAYLCNNQRDYYISPTQEVRVKTQPFRISIGYKLMLETTLSAEKGWQSGRTKIITDTLARRKKLNGLTLAVGVSSSLLLKKSAHNEAVAPYIDNYKISNIFPDFGVGYYLHKPDIHFNLACRNISGSLDAYNFYQGFNRKALTAEGYKFLGDYHGFAPFAGAAVSYERLRVDEDISGMKTNTKHEGIKPGIIAGWDIRPDRLQSWYLRTNIRWFPNMNVNMYSGKTVSLDQLEINFIQLVVFPGRLI